MATARARRLPVETAIVAELLLLAAIGVIGALMTARFASIGNFVNILDQSAALGFVALGQTLVVLAGGIDLSIGAIVSASAVMLAGLTAGNDAMMVPALVAVLAAGTAVGWFNGWLTTTTGVHPLIVTLGTASAINGAVLLYTLQPTGSVPFWFEEFAFGRVFGLPIATLVMMAAFVAAGVVLARTRAGRTVYAIGGNPEAARLSGIAVARTTHAVYAASGFLAALAGAYFVSRTGTGDPRVGDALTLASITPVILGGVLLGGGRGFVVGPLLGVLLMTSLGSLLNYLGVSTFLQWVVQGLVILAAVSLLAGKGKRT